MATVIRTQKEKLVTKYVDQYHLSLSTDEYETLKKYVGASTLAKTLEVVGLGLDDDKRLDEIYSALVYVK